MKQSKVEISSYLYKIEFKTLALKNWLCSCTQKNREYSFWVKNTAAFEA